MHHWHKHCSSPFFTLLVWLPSLLAANGCRITWYSNSAVWEAQHKPSVNPSLRILKPFEKKNHWKSHSWLLWLLSFYVNTLRLFCYSADMSYVKTERNVMVRAFKSNVLRDPNGMNECDIQFMGSGGAFTVVRVCTSWRCWNMFLFTQEQLSYFHYFSLEMFQTSTYPTKKMCALFHLFWLLFSDHCDLYDKVWQAINMSKVQLNHFILQWQHTCNVGNNPSLHTKAVCTKHWLCYKSWIPKTQRWHPVTWMKIAP